MHYNFVVHSPSFSANLISERRILTRITKTHRKLFSSLPNIM